MILIATWKKEIPNEEKYIVTFQSESEIEKYEVIKKHIIKEPPEPTKEGYKFLGWYLNEIQFDFNTPITADITLVATFVEEGTKTFNVSFDSNGGNNIKSQTIINGEKVKQPLPPTKSGYTFVEWQLNGKTYNFNTTVTGNITLTAKWNKNAVYTIKKTKVDNFSLDVKLAVYANDEKIGFKNIKYNGVTICTSSNPAVNAAEISSITTFAVTLSDDSIVTATVE